MHNMYTKKIEGTGKQTFILIHNAGGNHKMFTPQIDMLLTQGDVVLLDLPGHGASAPAEKNSIDASSSLIVDLVQTHTRNNICLIGLNNGANIALNALYQNHLPIEKMVLIDPPLMMHQSFINEIQDFINILSQLTEEKAYKAFVQDLVKNCLVYQNKNSIDIAFSAFMTVDKCALQAIFQSLIHWDKQAEKILASTQVPTLCIVTDEHHCRFADLKKAAPHFILGKVVGSKCWATLDVPEQVNTMIQRFLTLEST